MSFSLFAAVAAALVGPVDGVRLEFEHPAMGTLFRIVVHTIDEDAARAAALDAFARIDQLEGRLSDYDPESDLRRLESDAVGHPVPAHPDVIAVLAEGQEVARGTEGAFDVTIGALTRLWRWASRRGVPPPADRLEAARETVGHTGLIVDARAGTVTITHPGLGLDAGGIAKGYAVDTAFDLLATRGFEVVLVDGGGDIRVGRAPAGTAGWRITLPAAPHEKAFGASGHGWVTRVFENVAVATSGASHRRAELNDATVSHILDPRSGNGAPVDRIVTVLAETATRADALASALSVLGVEGLPAARRLGALRADVIEANGDHPETRTRAGSHGS